MIIEVIGGYEKAKQHIYDKALLDKKDRLSKIKILNFNSGENLITFIISVSVTICFMLYFLKTGFSESFLLHRCVLFLLSIVCWGSFIHMFHLEKKHYFNFIREQENKTLDEYVNYLNNSYYIPVFEDKWMIEDYENLQDFNSLLDSNIKFINYAQVKNNENDLVLIKEKINGDKETIVLNYVDFQYEDCDEDRLIWDKDGNIILYTKNSKYKKE